MTSWSPDTRQKACDFGELTPSPTNILKAENCGRLRFQEQNKELSKGIWTKICEDYIKHSKRSNQKRGNAILNK